MNYKWHYDKLIETRKDRNLDSNEYYESHHIIPTSMGGSNDKENLIKLTAREHFLAHWLLWRIHRNRQTSFAFYALCRFGKKRMSKWTNFTCSSRAYEEAKISKAIVGHSIETRLKISKSKKGKPSSWKGKTHSDESKKKMSEKRLGKPLSESTKSLIKTNNIGKHSHLFGNSNRKGHFHTEDTKSRISASRKGVKSGPFSEETKKNMSEARKLYWKNKKKLDR